MRLLITVLMIILGFALQFVSYFYLAAPLGIPMSPIHSEPRVPYASLLFVLGVMLVFLAAVVYEVLPEGEPETA